MTREEYTKYLQEAGATQEEIETLLDRFEEPEQENFQQDPASAETSVGSQPGMVSNLEDGLSEPPSKKDDKDLDKFVRFAAEEIGLVGEDPVESKKYKVTDDDVSEYFNTVAKKPFLEQRDNTSYFVKGYQQEETKPEDLIYTSPRSMTGIPEMDKEIDEYYKPKSKEEFFKQINLEALDHNIYNVNTPEGRASIDRAIEQQSLNLKSSDKESYEKQILKTGVRLTGPFGIETVRTNKYKNDEDNREEVDPYEFYIQNRDKQPFSIRYSQDKKDTKGIDIYYPELLQKYKQYKTLEDYNNQVEKYGGEEQYANYVNNRGFDLLTAKEQKYSRIRKEFETTKDDKRKQDLRLLLTEYDYGDQLYDPATGKISAFKEASAEALQIKDRGERLASQTDKETLEKQRAISYSALKSTALDILKIYQDDPDKFKQQFQGDNLMGTVKEFISGFKQDIDNLEKIKESGEIPSNISLFPKIENTAITEYNNALIEYLSINRALELNVNPLTTDKQNFAEGALDRLVEMSGTPQKPSKDEMANGFYNAVNAAGEQFIDQKSVDERLSQNFLDWGNLGHGTIDLVAIGAELALLRKSPVGVINKKVFELAGKFKFESKLKQRAFDLVSNGVKEGVEFAQLESIKGEDEEEILESFKFGTSLGFGNAVSSKVVKKIATSKIFSPATKLVNKYYTTNAIYNSAVGATAGSATYHFAMAANNTGEFKDLVLGTEENPNKYFGQHLLESFLAESTKMAFLGPGRRFLSKDGVVDMYDGMRRDIFRMKGRDIESEEAAKSLNINYSEIENTTKSAQFTIDKAFAAKNKVLERKFNLGKISKEELDKQRLELEHVKRTLENRLNINLVSKQIQEEKNNGRFANSGQAYIIGNKILQGKALTAQENTMFSELGIPFILENMGEPGRRLMKDPTIIDAMKKAREGAQAMEDLLNKSSLKTEYNSKEREKVYKSLLQISDINREIFDLKNKKDKNENDKQRIKDLEKSKTKILDETGSLVYEYNKERYKKERKKQKDFLKGRALSGEIIDNFETEEQFQEAYNKLSKKNPESSPPGDVKGSLGFYDPLTGNQYLNRPLILKVGAYGTPLHEQVHHVLAGELKDVNGQITDEGIKVIDGVLDKLTPAQRKVLEERIDDVYRYEKNEKGKIIRERSKKEYYEEYVTSLSEAMLAKEIVFTEDIGNALTAFIPIIKRNKTFENIDYGVNSGEQLFNLIKDFSKTVESAEKAAADLISKREGKTKVSKVEFSKRASLLESINDLIPKEVETKEDFLNPRVFNKIFNSLINEGGAINNYIKSRTTSREEAEIAIESVQDRLINFDPESKRKDGKPVGIEGFGEFIFANTKFGKLDAQKALAVEAAKKKQETRIDEGAKQIADIEEEVTTAEPAKEKVKISPLKFEGVVGKESTIEDIVDIKAEDVPNTTFKTVNDKYTGKVSSEIFNVPEIKITDPTKNLTYAKKIKDGVPEPSEAGNIQNFFQKGKNAENFIKILPRENVSSETAEIDAIGENIDVSKDVLGLGLGIPNKLLKYFYNKTDKRSKGKKSQPFIWKLKDEFINPSQDVINKFKEDLGITERGQLNKYDRNIGQFLKGVAKLQGQNTANLTARNKIEKISPEKTAEVKQTLADIAAAKSRVMLAKAKEAKNVFMKDDSFVKTSEEFAAENKVWKRILSNLDLQALDPKKSEDVAEFRSFIEEKLTNILPKSFFTAGTFANAGISASKRGFFFTSADDINSTIKDASFAKPDADIEAAVNRDSYAKIETKIKTKEFQASQKASLKGLKKVFKAFETLIKEDPNNAKYVGALLSSTSQSMGHFVRTSAPITFYSKVLEGGKVEEHTLPASLVAKYLFSAAVEGKVDEVFGDIEKNYKQGLLSKADDKKLKGFKPNGKPFNYISTTPEGWKITDNIWARYFNENVANNGGIDPSNIILANGNNIVQEFGIDAKGFSTNENIENSKSEAFKTNTNKTTIKYSKSKNNDGLLNDLNNHDKALRNARDAKAPKKGISVFDFDDTLATTKSMVGVTMPDGTEFKIDATEFAKRGSKLLEQGAEFDFSDFSKVVKGKPGPLIDKLKKTIDKFGAKDVYVLTARPENSATAIHQFLKGLGYEIPLENITGLANSTAQAKANWMIGKAAEGYNDFYFVDDAYKNVKAVQDAMKTLDVKSKERIVYANRLDKLDKEFNDILEAKTGIASEKEYSKAKAEVVGSNKGRFKFFIPPSAEDFVGLLYNTLSKGKLGDQQMAWYKKNLLDPYAKAMGAIARERTALISDYKALKKQLGIVPKNLRKQIKGEDFTREQAVRVYIWNKQGLEVPGLSKTDQKDLVKFIESDADLKVFADQLIAINKEEGYTKPKEGWLSGSITTDLMDGLGTTKRKKHLEQWQANADVIFSEANLNKLEAVNGKSYRVALENILSRMSSGRNRNFKGDTATGKLVDWLTGSIGTTMFFNTRSALLQTISAVNFINFTDNNVFKAGKAFANQKQYWKDFIDLMNSDYLVDRRQGLRINVSESDIADMAKKGGAKGVLNKLLQLGFTPTQIADSFAIASGGSTFYRNRIKSYEKQGFETKEAEAKAMQDFMEISEDSQQSSRPDKISMEQAGPLGRMVLAFANTPAQYARIIKKASKDLLAGRGDIKTNISKIIYYGVAQNLIFNALQQALFAIAFGDSDEEEKDEKTFRIANGMFDSFLRGTGVAGAFVSVGKNAIIRVFKELEKDRPKLEKVGYELTKISPPISSKLSRINQAARSYQWDKEEMKDKGFAIDNPALLAGANVISATTNIPVDRVVKKTNNIVQATTQDLEAWERIALLGGWQDWEIGIDKEPKYSPPVIYNPKVKRTRTRIQRVRR